MENSRNTMQKKVILEYLESNANKHLTIEEIEKDLEGKVGETTIYRMIKKLTEEGTVTKIPLNKQGFCYKYNNHVENCEEHFHLICEKCGRLTHFDSSKLFEAKKEALDKEDFNIDLDKIVFYGRCKKCSEGDKK